MTLNKEVLNLNPKMSSASGFIPATIIKQTIDVHLQHLTNAVNHTLQTNYFPDELKKLYQFIKRLQHNNQTPNSAVR